MPTLPSSPNFEVGYLIKTLSAKNVTLSYKYFWFLALLWLNRDAEMRCQSQRTFTALELMIKMAALAAYPLSFKLSFGFKDQLGNVAQNLGFDGTRSPSDEEKVLLDRIEQDPAEKRRALAIVRPLMRYVPFRFLSSWGLQIPDCPLRAAVAKTANFDRDIPYRFLQAPTTDGSWRIEINPNWKGYFLDNFDVLHGFAYWELSRYFYLRNPNTPAISSKLFYTPEDRSLTQQRKLWTGFIQSGRQCGHQLVRCIYDDSEVLEQNFALDHFMPWKFVAHNQLWNLTPITPSLNSSKSDRIPKIDEFVHPLAVQQIQFLRFCHAKKAGWSTILEDYAQQGITESIILGNSAETALTDIYRRIYSPMAQIALNSHFEAWAVTRSAPISSPGSNP